MSEFRNIVELIEWCSGAPEGTQIPAALVAGAVSEEHDGDCGAVPVDGVSESIVAAWTWRERLWTAPSETRIGVTEVAEALGRSKSWCYKRTAAECGEGRLPVRKLDGEVTMTVGELRTWIRQREEVEHGLPMDTAAWERRLTLVSRGEGLTDD